MGGACVARRQNRNAYKILIGKFGEKRPLRIRVGKWQNNIKVKLKGKYFF